MADYIESARTNYFKVKDAEAFKAWAAENDLKVIDRKDPYYALIGDLHNIPDPAEEDGDYLPVENAIGPHLADGEVCVVMSIGQENDRYYSGTADAFDSTGKVVHISIDDIYRQAKEEFGVEPSRAEY